MIKFEFAKLEPDTPQLDLLKYTPKETDAANARARQLDRTRLFSIQQVSVYFIS